MEETKYSKNGNVTVQELNDPDHSAFDNLPSNRSSFNAKELLLPCAIILLPISAVVVLLLWFVFHYEVHPPTFADPDLRVAFNETSPSHYYVDFSVSKISTIAGKFATCAGIATSSALVLLSIPISRRIYAHSLRGRHQNLPTPYQFTLLLAIFNGGMGAVVNYFRYRFAWGSQRARAPGFIFACAMVLTCFMGLQYTMVGAEVWLSSTMATVPYLTISEQAIPTYPSGRGLSASCLGNMVRWSGLNSTEEQCTVYYNTNSGVSTVNNAATAYSVLGNVSTWHNLWQTDGYMLPVPSDIPQSLDFTAESFALRTQCKPITQACNADIDGNFDCTPAGFDFSGPRNYPTTFNHTPFQLQFTNPALSGGSNCTGVNCWNQSDSAIKGHFALLETIDFDFEQWETDPQARPIASETSTYFILGCEYFAYNVKYSMVESNIVSLTTRPMNMTTMFSLNFPMQQSIGDDFLKASLTPLVAASNSTTQIASSFESLFSQTFLGLSAGALSNRTALAEQTRSTMLVAKIPKFLLWLNVGLPFLLAAAGVAIAAWAFVAQGNEAGRDVREKLSVPGLVAQRYVPTSPESPKDILELFKESERDGKEIRVVATQGRHGTWELKPSYDL